MIFSNPAPSERDVNKNNIRPIVSKIYLDNFSQLDEALSYVGIKKHEYIFFVLCCSVIELLDVVNQDITLGFMLEGHGRESSFFEKTRS